MLNLFQYLFKKVPHKEVAISQIFPLLFVDGKSKKIKGKENHFYFFFAINRILIFIYKYLLNKMKKQVLNTVSISVIVGISQQ